MTGRYSKCRRNDGGYRAAGVSEAVGKEGMLLCFVSGFKKILRKCLVSSKFCYTFMVINVG